MTYEEAMGIVAQGGVVARDGRVIYMSVDFSAGTAGKTVVLSGLMGDSIYDASSEDEGADDWTVFESVDA